VIYLWDSDTFSWWQRAPGTFQSRLDRLGSEDAVALSAVTVHEALRGRLAYVAQARDERAYRHALAALVTAVGALSSWPILPYTTEAAARFARLRSGRGSRGMADLRIAATAIEAGAVLVTRNAAYYSDLPGLTAENWVDG